ncbi:hypothetical protein IGI04_042596 [Brassica rapa subsp. trilocularis]|uniref:Uncharacterized protein n=1 Tax=Brassica rapa subsp. trilocularis TaxID=1813537 RepID=A0ABQ7KMC8_BRACM|nr:hypothetical protein IGI04_042596 [Brassica rapa subsp. trilocularis]
MIGNGKSFLVVTYTGASSSRSNDDYIKRSDLDALFKMLKENGNTYGYSFGASMITYKDDLLIRELN